MSWFCSSMFDYQIIMLKLFLYIFHNFMGFYQSQNAKFSFPINPWPGFYRSTGPVDRAWSRSTESVDRRAQTCTPVLAGGPVDQPGRPQRASALWKAPVDRAGRPTERSALCSRVSVDRPVDRCPNGQKSDRWRSNGRSTVRPTWLQRLVFLAL